MNTFPTLSTGPKTTGFTDEYNDDAVAVSPAASGAHSLRSKLTFDGKSFSFSLTGVSQTDKETLETFYSANKSVVFYWLNEQDEETYEVLFAEKPYCELDGEKDKWKIGIKLIQA